MATDRNEARALSDIESHGCHIIHVFEDETGPGFSYSIGIERESGQPELIVTGLKRELAHWIINEYNGRVREGETFAPDKPYPGFLVGFDVYFLPMSEAYYSDYLGWGRWLYKGNNFRAYQLIWPSTKGVWPWNPDAPSEYIRQIPLLSQARPAS